ncbi:MAG: hypothetical protein HC867_09715 [Bacteroidia bacterium]|nr:hypothetical protein [Bacteroidia bacterium]
MILTINAGWLWKMSPRSVTGWYSTGKSIGLYPPGVDGNGGPSLYKDNTKSNGIGILGLVYKKNYWAFQAWDTWVENIMNTALLQTEFNFTVNKKEKFIAGLQFTAQHGVGRGGNADSSKQYYPKGSKSFVISGKLGYSGNRWETNLNYTRISSDGRFLMPREWGREPFYTFMLRERNEGFGDVNAVAAAFCITSKIRVGIFPWLTVSFIYRMLKTTGLINMVCHPTTSLMQALIKNS